MNNLSPLEAIFFAALEKASPPERAAYLDEACAGDAELRRRVEKMLSAQADAGSFLEASPVDLGQALQELSDRAGSAETELQPESDDAFSLDFLSPSEQPGHLGRLAHYEILEVIGRGGMGIVLRAFDEKLHRVIAIKVMAAQLATSAAGRKRFMREARAAAAVSHDHIVTIHAVEEAEGLPYLVMQCVAGVSLQERLDRGGPLELHEILRIGLQTASGLAAAHAQGLIHRDIKPANILLENGVERVKITDFGLARVVADADLTQSGVVAGTPNYMAPEQARGEVLDARTDLFSLGSVLYAMCTGRSPFRASGTMAVLRRVCEETPTPIRETNPEIPEWLVAITEKLHAKHPAERFQSAAEVADLLSRHLAHVQHPEVVPLPVADKPAGGPAAARRPRWAMAAAVFVLLFGGLSLSEATGVTSLRAVVIRIFTPEGTLIVEADDPNVRVTIEGDGGLVITGAGPQEVRLKPGSYRVEATKDGKPVKREVVTITRGGKQVVNVSVEAQAQAPVSLALPEIRRFEGHAEGVQSVAISADGHRIVSGSDDRTVRLWDLNTGKELRRFEGHSDKVYSVAFSPDGRRVLSGSFDMTVRLWDVETGKELRRFSGHTDLIVCVAYSPDGRRALSGSEDNTVRLWDVESGEELRRLEGHPRALYSVAFSPDGGRALSGGWDRTMRLWDVETGKELRRFEGHKDVVKSVAFSPDGRRALSAGGTDKTVRLWDLETGEELRRFEGHRDWAHSVAFSADGLRAVSGGTLIVYLWDVQSGRLLQSFLGHTGEVADVAVSPDGRHALSADWDGDNTLRLWQLPELTADDARQAAAKAGRSAFVLLGGQGIPERTFDTLAEAVLRSGGGDTIEIRGNGPFISDGMTIRHPLVIRAGEGYTPSITLSKASADTNTPLLNNAASLTLEGLELRRMGGAAGWVQNRLPKLLDTWHGETLHIANCRLILDTRLVRVGEMIGGRAAQFTLRNCELRGAATYAASWRFASRGRCSVENCVSAGGLIGFHQDDPDAADVAIRVRGNTLLGDCISLVLWSKPNLREGGEAAPPIRLDFARNIAAPSPRKGILFLHQTKSEGPYSSAEAESLLPRLIGLDEQQNVYLSGTRMLQFGIDWKVIEGGTRGQDLADWDRFWGQQNTGSAEGDVRFHGGDLIRLAQTAPEQLTPADFRLRPDSAGYRAGPDGKDLGANVDLVGPGPAYKRWKKTPEYQQWLKETGQVQIQDAEVSDPAYGPLIQLFNGTDLTGWKTHPASPGAWKVTDGILQGSSVQGHLFSERSDFENFHLRVEARINLGGDSSICFRAPFALQKWGEKLQYFGLSEGYDVELQKNPARILRTGSITGIHSRIADPSDVLFSVADDSLVKPDEWFTLEIIAQGNHLVTRVNGKQTADCKDPLDRSRAGHLVLHVFSPITIVQFKKIEIRELPTGKAAPAEPLNRDDRPAVHLRDCVP